MLRKNNVALRDTTGGPELYKAALCNEKDAVANWLKVGVHLTHWKHPQDGGTPLHAAVIRGSVRIVQILVDAGADPNLRDKNYMTPLHHAAIGDNMAITAHLLAGGSNHDARDENDRTPLDLARAAGCGDRFHSELLKAKVLKEAVAQPVQPILVAPTKKALVFGFNYQRSKSATLKCPVNDANAVALVLQQMGFVVTLRTDENQKVSINQARDMVDDFHDSLSKRDTAVFYFSGHACEYENENYLVTSDEIGRHSHLRASALNAQQVLRGMQAKQTELNVMFLDCCRVFRGMTKAGGGGLAAMAPDTPSSDTQTVIGFATSPGSVAYDGDRANSLYTKHLLRHIATPGLEIDLMLRKVAGGVQDEAKSNVEVQIPYVSHTLVRSVFLA